MPHDRIEEIDSTFDEIYGWLQQQDSIQDFVTTGGVEFVVSAGLTQDHKRRFLALPHGNRVYEDDWGYRSNSMGKVGQRIG